MGTIGIGLILAGAGLFATKAYGTNRAQDKEFAISGHKA